MTKTYSKTKCAVLLAFACGIFGSVSAQMFYGDGSSTIYVDTSLIMYVKGGITVSSTSSITGKGTLQLTGNLTNNGIVDFSTPGSTGTVNFSDTVAQTCGGSNKVTVANLILSNTNGLTLQTPVTVTKATTLGSLVNTDPTNVLIYANGATTGIIDDSKHVNGPVRYTGTGTFTYPVGNASLYRPIGTSLTANSNGLTAAYFKANATTGPGNTVFTLPLMTVNKSEYWDLTPVSSATGTVNIYWDTTKVSLGTDMNKSSTFFTVAHSTGGTWNSEGGTLSGNNVTGSVVSTNTVSSWSPFSLGSTGMVLPVNFLGVNAVLLADGSRRVNWQVAQEYNVKNYILLRSTNGVNFTAIGQVAATGNYLGQNYSYVDAAPLTSSQVYYKVQSNDLDGKIQYSSIASLSISGNSSFKVQPTIATSNVQVIFGNNMAGNYSIDLVSMLGQPVYHGQYNVVAGQVITIARPVGAANGTYLVKCTKSDGTVQIQKVVFQ